MSKIDIGTAMTDMPVFKVPRTPGLPPKVGVALAPAPRIVKHGCTVLGELGYDADAIARMVAEQVVALP